MLCSDFINIAITMLIYTASTELFDFEVQEITPRRNEMLLNDRAANKLLVIIFK
jgi:hypothetical protein